MAKKVTKSGAPGKGMKWKGTVSGRVPYPEMVPVNSKPAKLKPMRTIASGTTGSGKAKTTVRSKTRG